ncbi:MAG: hypothetical protein LH616_17805 [Ilumatobacteraceae bacterium]|nr:hypothetical protein [Ilumatobacteraceae bacterium]
MLPDGWTIERVMAVAQGHAEMVSTDVPAIVDEIEPGAERLTVGGTSSLTPLCTLRFGDLYLVQEADDQLWYMGSARPDGVIHCWAAMATIEDAIEGL